MRKLKARSFYPCGIAFALTALLALTLAPRLGIAETPVKGGKLVYVIPASWYPSLDAHQETTYATIHPSAPFYSL
ncbi:MAG: hypothetical protein ACE5JQ_16745, partial [Candidatus Methylomirabilales bacterium]